MWSNPVLIGALTVLVTIAAVTLAYQANNGLPFVPKYTLHVQIADAEELTHGAEVHMGGALVGLVDTVDAGRDAARAADRGDEPSLDKSVEPLPVDSIFDVRLKGAIGLKYLDVTRGRSTATWANGATVPLGQSRRRGRPRPGAVDVQRRRRARGSPARRSASATRSRAAAATSTTRSARSCRSSPISGRWRATSPRRAPTSAASSAGSSRSRARSRPVAQTQASLYSNLDTTFKALAPVAVPFLQEWISETPPTFQTVIADSPQIRRS